MKAEYAPFKVQEVVDLLGRFHTHLGPYLIIGARMAEIAIERLGFDPFKMKAIVYTGITPPLSCMIDGIQFISGCTLGKGNIQVEDGGIPEAKFIKDDKTILFRLLKHPDLKGLETKEVRQVALEYAEMPIEDFLEILE
ncbi:MAG: formylmethanofuran dehydrogenase subunit E family protein [Candidatus Heimdallarchaeota archaeon]|nr:formylmethanofuran dehydrogenase subunit E family protein [Candidatus Heimdallarchaeota archaeon]